MEKQTQQQPSFEDQLILGWSAPAVTNHDRSKKWYAIAGSIMGILVLQAIWTGNWSFVIVLMLMCAVYVAVHKKEPGNHTMEFWFNGLQYDGKFFAWNQFAGYWMLQGEGYVELRLAKKEGNPKELMIQLGEITPDEIRMILNTFLPEFSDRIERPLDTLIRLLKI